MLTDAGARWPQIVEYVLRKNAAIFQRHYAAAVLGREQEIARLQRELRETHEQHQRSREYRLGRAVLAPGRWIKRNVFKTFIPRPIKEE